MAAMLDDLAKGWTLDELAARANASRASLVRMFQRMVRLAPLEFLAELRLELARRKLSATALSVAAIADEIGYNRKAPSAEPFTGGTACGPARPARVRACSWKNPRDGRSSPSMYNASEAVVRDHCGTDSGNHLVRKPSVLKAEPLAITVCKRLYSAWDNQIRNEKPACTMPTHTTISTYIHR